MAKPRRRQTYRRKSDNEKRRLLRDPTDNLVQDMLNNVHYQGSPKHKLHPHLFGLPPLNGQRGDATLCDDADFEPGQMAEIPMLIRRGIRAGLIGHTQRIIWTVADDGWIFEARETNRATAEFHGYPVLPTEAIAHAVFDRFSDWVERQGTDTEQSACDSCRLRYGF